MGKYVIVDRIPMKDGVIVEPIEIKADGTEIYPIGTVIKATIAEKGNRKVTAKRSCQPKPKLIDLMKFEEDCFENNYGFDKLAKEMQQFKDDEYLRKLAYWQSEEGQMRIAEMKKYEPIKEVQGFGKK